MAGNALVTKLEIFADLTEGEKRRLDDLCQDGRRFGARQHIIRAGDRPNHVHLISSGWAARYVSLSDGSQRIVAFLIPGDFCDQHVTLLGKMDHSIVALTHCHVCFIPSDRLDDLTSEEPKLTKALWWATLVDEAVLRSWVANVGGRDAYGRVAHLLCELHLRMSLVGLVSAGRLDLPLSQQDIADATGLTPVHTNRMLQRLRRENLIELRGHILTVLDIDALRETAGFDGSYLHIKRRQPVRS